MVKCSNCGFDAGESKFCPNCGSEIVIEEPAPSCPNCGAEVGDSKFCPNCGTKIESEPSTSFCPNCGSDVGNSAFCPNCGTKIEKEPPKPFCPNCGFDVGDSAFCPNCGTKLGTGTVNQSNGETSGESDFLDNVIDVDDKISGKVGGLFGKSRAMDKLLDKTASYRYKNLSKSTNNGMDRKYYEKIEPVFLEVLDSIDDDYVRDILLFQRSMMSSGGGIVGIAAAQVYTPTKEMSHEDGIRFYQNMANEIVLEINAEKQKGTFDEEEFYKRKVKENTINNVSLFGISKSVKAFKNNQK